LCLLPGPYHSTVMSPELNPDLLRQRLAAARDAPDASVFGDEPPADLDGATLAGVLVPFTASDGIWSLVFTRRSEDLPSHKGEISFPGGKVDRGETGLQAALREAHEEMGIDPAHVEILGRLPRVFTVVTGFVIEPWVGLIPHSDFTVNQGEIAEVLEVPLAVLRDSSTVREQKFIRGKAVYANWAFDVGPNIIWGATARVLKSLLDLIE